MIAAGRMSNTSRTIASSFSGDDLRRAERLDHDRHRVRDADRVRDLRLAPLGEPGGDDVLRDLAHRVRGRAVDLGRVLARERAAAVAGHAAVGVDDDLAAGEPAVGVRTAELERRRSGSRSTSKSSSANCSGSDGRITCSMSVGLHLRRRCRRRAVLRRDQHGRRAASARRPRTRPRPGSCRRGAGSRGCRPCGPAARRSASRCASQIGIGMRSSVSSHA